MNNFNAEEVKLLKEISNSYDHSLSKYATKNSDAIRFNDRKQADHLRSPYVIDCDNIIHSTQYNRYTDKTQVFSFYKNDDITRRALHVQLVSSIARTIGRALRLNIELIEAIAIGHDMGHTPFGHRGEQYLNELYHKNTGRYFNHNVHSVRIFKTILNTNLTLQTLDGILCHNGEKAFQRYEPNNVKTIKGFNDMLGKCYTDKEYSQKIRPSTLEGCVVRISDMLAYIYKDRQDAKKAELKTEKLYESERIGSNSREFLTNTTANIVKNSINKPYLSMDSDVYAEITKIQSDNYEQIYNNPDLVKPYDEVIKPMMNKIYNQFICDIDDKNYSSYVFKHYLNHAIQGNCYRNKSTRAIIANNHDIVTDFIASMTDDYFLDLFKELYPDNELNLKIKYVSYFTNS
jgi:dGTPase